MQKALGKARKSSAEGESLYLGKGFRGEIAILCLNIWESTCVNYRIQTRRFLVKYRIQK